jgi:hypothetical protein
MVVIPVVTVLTFPIASRERNVSVTDPVKVGALMDCVLETHGSLGLLQVRLLFYARHARTRMTRFLKRG